MDKAGVRRRAVPEDLNGLESVDYGKAVVMQRTLEHGPSERIESCNLGTE